MITASTTRTLLRASLRSGNSFSRIPSSSRTVIIPRSAMYTATAMARGEGRSGTVDSGGFHINLMPPRELGGAGFGTNPEQLLAMAFAGSMLGSVQAFARLKGKEITAKYITVETKVSVGEASDRPGVCLQVDIHVIGIDEEIVKTAHEYCPFSRAFSQGAVVNISADDGSDFF